MAESEKSHPRLILEIKASKSAILCSDCDRPILEISNGELKILSKHGNAKHENVLTIEYLQMLAFEMMRQKG